MGRKAIVVCCGPVRSAFWKFRSVKRMQRDEMVGSDVFDGCKFGVRVQKEGRKVGEHWRNEMRVVTNSLEVLEELRGRCREEVRHISGRGSGKRMKEVDEKVWERVMASYMKGRAREKVGLRAVAVVKEEAKFEDKWHEHAVAVDDVSGVRLDPRKVLEARLEELKWMGEKGV